MSQPIRFDRAHISGVVSDHAKNVHKISLTVPFGSAEDAMNELKQLEKLGQLKSDDASIVHLAIEPYQTPIPLEPTPLELAIENAKTPTAAERI